MKKTILFTLIFLFFTIMSINNTFATIPVPTSQQFYQYTSIATSVLNDNPANAMPVGVGSIATGGDTLSLQVGLNQFSGTVDIYLALHAPTIDPVNIYLIKSDNTFQTVAEGLTPWKGNTQDPVNENLFGNIQIQLLPPGTYNVYLLVTPVGNLNNGYYFWATNFFIGGWTFQEFENAVVNSLGNVDNAFDAVALAIDKGYSLRQVTEAGLTGRLSAKGEITNWSGTGEVPENQPTNIFIENTVMNELSIKLAADIVKESKSSVGQISIETFRKTLEYELTKVESIYDILFFIIWALERGYTPEQIVAGLMLGTVGTYDDNVVIWDENGYVINPKNPKQNVFDIEKSIITFPFTHCTIEWENIYTIVWSSVYDTTWEVSNTSYCKYKGKFEELFFSGTFAEYDEYPNCSALMSLNVYYSNKQYYIGSFSADIECILVVGKTTETNYSKITGAGIPVNITEESISGSVSGTKACESIKTFEWSSTDEDENGVYINKTLPPHTCTCDGSSFIHIWCENKE